MSSPSTVLRFLTVSLLPESKTAHEPRSPAGALWVCYRERLPSLHQLGSVSLAKGQELHVTTAFRSNAGTHNIQY